LQSKFTNQPHPLLAPELLKVKTNQELYGSAQPYGQIQQASSSTSDLTAGSGSREEHVQQFKSLSLNSQPPYADQRGSKKQQFSRDSTPPEIGSDILQLSATFPFPWAVDVSIRKRIRDALPPKDEAMRICEEARNNALWQ